MSRYKITLAAPVETIVAAMQSTLGRDKRTLGPTWPTYSYEVEASSSSAAVDELLVALEHRGVSPDGIACSARLVTP